MAVRDLLWGCPICREPGGIRPDGRRERCHACGATFRRGSGAAIIVEHQGRADQRAPAEWLAALGAIEVPRATSDGRLIGPERVRVKHMTGQKPLRLGSELLGWVEAYSKAATGAMVLRTDGLHFTPERGGPVHWAPEDITGLQPASSSLQLGLHGDMASVKFLEGSVRLWTRAVSDLVREHHRRHGRDVLEFQPFVRTCLLDPAP